MSLITILFSPRFIKALQPTKIAYFNRLTFETNAMRRETLLPQSKSVNTKQIVYFRISMRPLDVSAKLVAFYFETVSI